MPRQRAKERACERAIKRTLAYRTTFKYPLTFYQLTTYLISKKNFEYQFFKKILRRQLKNKSVRIKKSAYYLPAVRPVSWETRMDNSLSLYKDNEKVFYMLSKIPWIQLICVTGSLASYNTTEDSDIDLFIVTEQNRLWISRLFVVLILKLLNRYPNTHGERGKICPNIMIDENNMAWEKSKRNIFIANEITLMQPVFNKNDTYYRFIKENSWILKHFSNFKIYIPGGNKDNPKRSTFIDKAEKKLMEIQLNYMKDKKTTEVTQPGFIHFNVKDSTRRVIRNYKNQLKKLDIKE